MVLGFRHLNQWLQASIILCGLSLSAGATAGVNLSTNDFVCAEVSDSCYARIFDSFERNRSDIATPQGLAGRIRGSSSILRLQPHRTKHVYLMIHGLWSVETHFNPLGEWIAGHKGSNVLQFTLPGHGYGRENAANKTTVFSYQDWQRAAREALSVAKLFGDEIILVGHSIGGALSIQETLTHDPQIKAMVLIEPAIRVDPFLTIPDYFAQFVIKDFESLAPLAGYHPDHAIPSYMGWVADLLTRDVFQEYQHEPVGIPDENIVRVAQRVRVPVLIFNNVFDYVIEPSSIRAFAHAHPRLFTYVPFDQDFMIRHGLILKPENLHVILNDFVPFINNALK